MFDELARAINTARIVSLLPRTKPLASGFGPDVFAELLTMKASGSEQEHPCCHFGRTKSDGIATPVSRQATLPVSLKYAFLSHVGKHETPASA